MTGLHSLALGLGLLLLFLGDVFTPGTFGPSLLWAGRLVFVTAVGLRVAAFTRLETKVAKRVGRNILIAYAGVSVALILCFVASDGGRALLALEAGTTLQTFLGFLWPALLIGSLLPLVFMEAVYGFMPVEEAVDERRVRSAAFGGLTIALAAIFVVSINVSARERDVREDLSYFRVSEPSQGTVQTVKALDEKLDVILLFSKGNDVLLKIQSYFRTLDSASPNLTVEVRDHALAPELTRKNSIPDNGYVVISFGDDEENRRVQKLKLGTDLVEARSNLRTLDGRVRRLLTQVTTVPRELYFTAGHDERSGGGIEGEAAGERLSMMDGALRQNNIAIRTLGVSQGLAQKVPDKAPAVAVVGPKKPFLPEEVNALITYVKGGGRLAVFVDPDVDHGLGDLLGALGLKLEPGVVASNRYFRRRTGTKADRMVVYTDRYSAHPTVTLAMRNASRGIASIFLGGGAISDAPLDDRRIKGTKPVFPITTRTEYWLDLNGNYEREEEEWSRQFNMMAAVTVPNESGGKEGRVVVLADGDFFTDQVIRNPGNGLVLSDILEWLIGQQQIVGEISSEEDVQLERTNEEDKLIFWGFSLLIPLFVAAPGAWLTFSRRRRRRGVSGSKKARDASAKRSVDPSGDGTDEKKNDVPEAESGKATSGADAGEPVAEEPEGNNAQADSEVDP